MAIDLKDVWVEDHANLCDECRAALGKILDSYGFAHGGKKDGYEYECEFESKSKACEHCGAR